MSQNTRIDANTLGEAVKDRVARGCLDKLYKNALLIIILLIVGGILFSLGGLQFIKSAPTKEVYT